MKEETQKDLGQEIPDASKTVMNNPYYKPVSDKWDFKLLNEECHESYQVWDNNKKTFLKETIIDAANRVQKVKATQYMKKEDFELAFPGCQKNSSYNRDVVVDGTIYRYGFKQSQNSQLIQQIETIKNLGQRVEDVVFTLKKQTKSGKELNANTPFHDVEYNLSTKLDTSVSFTEASPVKDSVTATDGGGFVDTTFEVSEVEKDLFKEYLKAGTGNGSRGGFINFYKDESLKSGVYEGDKSDLRAGKVYDFLI